MYAQDYDLETLLKLFPQEDIRQTSEALARISQQTVDKVMYDSREKAIRHRNWELAAARHEGKQEGMRKGRLKGTIQTLQEVVRITASSEDELDSMSLEQLESLKTRLQEEVRNR